MTKEFFSYRDRAEALDFPVLFPFRWSEDSFLLLTKASSPDRAIPGWESMSLKSLLAAVWSGLKAKVPVGHVDSPDDPEEAIGDYQAEGWYVVGRPQLVGWASQQFRSRYPGSRINRTR